MRCAVSRRGGAQVAGADRRPDRRRVRFGARLPPRSEDDHQRSHARRRRAVERSVTRVRTIAICSPSCGATAARAPSLALTSTGAISRQASACSSMGWNTRATSMLALLDALFAQMLRAAAIACAWRDARPAECGGRRQSRRAGCDDPSVGSGPAAMFLGVDGGGTKTAYALIDAHGKLRASACRRAVSATWRTVSSARAQRCSAGSAAMLAEGRHRPPPKSRFAFFGLPAYGEDSATTAQLDAMPARAPRRSEVSLRQRHGLRLGGLARLRRRHQRHRRHRLDGVRRVRRAHARVRAAGASSSATKAPPTGSRARA